MKRSPLKRKSSLKRGTSQLKRSGFKRKARAPMRRKATGESVAGLRNALWGLVSKYVRQSAANEYGTVYCYTCHGGPIQWKEAHAAHAIGGRRAAVLFDTDLIKPCCYTCNVTQRGNYPAFKARLIAEHGYAWWSDKIANSKRVVKLTRADLQEKMREYRTKLDLIAYRG